jgi:hypothetical protein
MMVWLLQDGYTPDALGYLPSFMSDEDPRPAVEQIAENHSGGWDSFKGFTVGEHQELLYPGDPPLMPIAFTTLHDETVILYQCDFVRVMQPDGSFDVARIS